MEFGKIKDFIGRKSESFWDRQNKPSEMEFEDFDNILIAGERFNVAQSAKRLIGQRLSIPAPYLDRCPPELQAENLNYWLRRQDDDHLFCRFDDRTLRALFTKRYAPMDNHEIINQLTIPESTECQFRFDDGMMQLSIPDRKGAFEVAKNDEMVPGVSITNSEVGVKAFGVSAWYLRIACLNGMVVSDYISQNFRHTSTRGLDNFCEVMSGVSVAIMKSNEKFKVAIDANVDNPMVMIENLAKKFLFTGKEIEHIKGYYDGPQTMYGIIQAFTAAAKYSQLTVERSYAMERAGGKILMLTKH